MALDYVRNGDDPRLLQMAKEIVTYQSSEIGMMNEYLAQWDQAGNRPAKAMGWMQPPIPYSEMPGLATQAQMDQLAAARGFELDSLFTQLMINHHAGGVHMAATAAKTRGGEVDPPLGRGDGRRSAGRDQRDEHVADEARAPDDRPAARRVQQLARPLVRATRAS